MCNSANHYKGPRHEYDMVAVIQKGTHRAKYSGSSGEVELNSMRVKKNTKNVSCHKSHLSQVLTDKIQTGTEGEVYAKQRSKCKKGTQA